MSRRALLWLAMAGCAGPTTTATFLGTPLLECRDGGEGPRGERCLGSIYDRLLSLGERAYDDPTLTAYVSRVGGRVAAAAAGGHVFTFRVLDSSEAQASALPGGFIYVTRGALAHLGSEAELAALLAHEIGHVVSGHGDQDADDEHDEDRDEERQADELAVALTRAAGYDAAAVADMLIHLERAEPDPTGGEGSHPALETRVARVARAASGRPGGERRVADYLRRVDGLVLGDDPRVGRVLGRTWTRAASDVALDLPAGWAATGKPGAFEATSAGRGVSASVGGFETQWLRFLAGLGHERRPLRVLGRRGEVVWFDADEDDRRVTRFAWVESGREALMIAVSGLDREAVRAAHEELLGALRRPTDAELRAVLPRRIHLARASGPGPLGALGPACPEAVRLNGGDERRPVSAGMLLKCAGP
jgi:predicted Zn-dependent protease